MAVEEFPKKESELPLKLLSLLKKYKNFQIFWVKEDIKNFKKFIPTINRFKNDLIITLDDDILYPNNLFENMLKCYKLLGGNNPVSFGKQTSDWIIDGKYLYSHYGGGSVVKYNYYNNKINEIFRKVTKDRISKGIKCPDDVLYTYAALLNGYKYKRCKKYVIKVNSYIPEEKNIAFSENNKNYTRLYHQYHSIIRQFIKNTYNKTILNIIEKVENQK